MEFHRSRKIDANIDMTPMIDTLLQLFMIFLLSATFVASSVRLNLPKAGPGPKAPGKAVVVSIDAGSQLFVNNEPISLEQLPARMRSMLDKDGKQEFLLLADRDLPYGRVLNV